jgi:release factor glutamine methyltransferase
MWVFRPPGVYRPQYDTWLLAEAMANAPLPPGARVLDMCTGTGTLAVIAAQQGAAEVVAVDRSRRAVLTAWLNGRLHRAPVRAIRADITDLLDLDPFDVVVANPPYVPCADPMVPTSGTARCWDAGPRGRAVLDRLCAVLPMLLRPDGMALVVHSELSGTDTTLHQLRGAGLKASVVARRMIGFGPVLRSRAGWLVAQGLIEPGQREEELVVVRADKPGCKPWEA